MHAKRVLSLDDRHKCILTKKDLENAFKLLKNSDSENENDDNMSLQYLYI
jgi:hypothetical protein